MTQRIIFCNLVFTKFKNIFNKDWMTCKIFFWIWLRFPRDITVESKCLILTLRCYNFKLYSRNSMSANKLLQKIWLFFKKLQEVIIKKQLWLRGVINKNSALSLTLPTSDTHFDPEEGLEFALWFFERIASSLQGKEWYSDSLTVFCKERRERVAHSHSVLKSDESESFKVAL